MTPNQLSLRREALDKEVARLLDKKIKAACDKTGWEYYGGMGAWNFSGPKGRTLNMMYPYASSGPAILKRLATLMHKYDEVSPYLVSNYCTDYRPANFKRS